MTKEQKFYNALKDIFVGAKVEGESGYINLMRIKSRYYEKGVFPKLQEDIEKAIAPFPEFKEELFDKLYTFFHRYFSESGSIYFRYTPIHQNVYEKVYTDDRDVILFWKTHMLYYVKTDRLFKNLEVEIPPQFPLGKGGREGGFKFFFDVSNLEHKKANEKREIIFEFKGKRKDGVPVFSVSYSERGKKTKIDDILRSLKKEDIEITEEILERAFRVFEKQSEVDYFINKNAKEFLREQFNLWLYQYVFSGESEWTEKRIKQLQVLKDIAFKIIDFISQFEDELVKIWNKPKFVLNSNYVITLDRIAEREGGLNLIEKILEHKNLNEQVREWKELGIVDEDFEIESLFEIDSEDWVEHQSSLFEQDSLKEKKLITTGYHLPYNPDLVHKAKQLRKNMTEAEKRLWYKYLRNFKHRVYRQRPIDQYIVDFYCPALRLVIEIDGESHYTDEGKQYDKRRTEILEGYGLRVIRFTNIDVLKNFEGVCKVIEDITPQSPLTNGTEIPSVFPLNKGGNIPPISPLDKGGIKGGINKKYKHLPIDTRYFKDLEPEILELFDDLDNSLDGWLIKSENYQALNTILPKFKEKVQTIYIDPPFNKEQDADYFYSVKYKDASWITILENRLQLAKFTLNPKGSIFVRCDYNGNAYVRMLLNEIFGSENFRNEIIVKRGAPKAAMFEQFEGVKSMGVMYDNLLWYSHVPDIRYHGFKVSGERKGGYWNNFYDMKPSGERPTMRYKLFGILPPKNYYWKWGKERGLKAVENYKEYLEIAKTTGETLEEYYLRTGIGDFVKLDKGSVKYWVRIREEDFLVNNWLDIPGYSSGWGFKTENSEILLKRVIESISNEGDLIMDFFLGSGTTTAVAHKLKRKWIGVEMGEHFWSVILPRMKKVLAYDKSGISKEKDVKEKYNQNNAGGFFKYYELEQYEDTLRKVKYEDAIPPAPLIKGGEGGIYNQYVFMKDLKMLSALEVDYENNKVKVDLSKLYPFLDSPLNKGGNIPPVSPLNKGGIKGGIDIPETLSNLLGKWIKKLKVQNSKVKSVVFEDGEEVDIENLDYKLIKPLIWW